MDKGPKGVLKTEHKANFRGDLTAYKGNGKTQVSVNRP